MKKSSLLTLSALLVSTTFIVNCQQSPNGKKDGQGVTDHSDIAAEKAIPTEQCDSGLMKNYKSWVDKYTKLHPKMTIDESKLNDIKNDETVKSDLAEKSRSILDQCKLMIPALKLNKTKSCLLDENQKSSDKVLSLDYVQKVCNKTGTFLKSITGESTTFSDDDLATTLELKSQKEALSYLDDNQFTLATDAESLLDPENNDWAMIIVNGEVMKAENLKKALSAKKTVCTFAGSTEKKSDSDDVIFQVGKPSTRELEDINKPEDYQTSATTGTAIKFLRNGTVENAMLVEYRCLNLKYGKFNLNQLQKAFGKVLKSSKLTKAAVDDTNDLSDKSADKKTETKATAAPAAKAAPAVAATPADASASAAFDSDDFTSPSPVDSAKIYQASKAKVDAATATSVAASEAAAKKAEADKIAGEPAAAKATADAEALKAKTIASTARNDAVVQQAADARAVELATDKAAQTNSEDAVKKILEFYNKSLGANAAIPAAVATGK